MNSKYLKYTLEELIEDKDFVAWVLKEKNDKAWKLFLENNPEIRSSSKKGREIILMLRDSYQILDEESVLEVWQNIDKYSNLNKLKSRRLTLRRNFNRAASVLLIISLGILGYNYFNPKDNYQFVSHETESKNEARIILSSGEEIALNKDNSSILLNEENSQVVVNDSVINLKEDGIKKQKMNEVSIPYGKRSELLLADGTKVWLNAGSQLAFPTTFSGNKREVYLIGEACFKVTKNEEQPFVVKTGDLNIQVLGTFFNVSAYPEDDNIATVLLEGSVAVKKNTILGLPKNEVILKPYQRANFSVEMGDLSVANDPKADEVIAWTEGWYIFHRESLESVCVRLERYYNVQVNMPDNFPSEELITGKLDLKGSIEDVLIALSDVAQIEYRVTNNKVFIDKKIKEIQRRR